MKEKYIISTPKSGFAPLYRYHDLDLAKSGTTTVVEMFTEDKDEIKEIVASLTKKYYDNCSGDRQLGICFGTLNTKDKTSSQLLYDSTSMGLGELLNTSLSKIGPLEPNNSMKTRLTACHVDDFGDKYENINSPELRAWLNSYDTILDTSKYNKFVGEGWYERSNNLLQMNSRRLSIGGMLLSKRRENTEKKVREIVLIQSQDRVRDLELVINSYKLIHENDTILFLFKGAGDNLWANKAEIAVHCLTESE